MKDDFFTKLVVRLNKQGEKM